MDNKEKVFFDNNVYDKLLTLDKNDIKFLQNSIKIFYCDTITDEFNEVQTNNQNKYKEIKKILNGFERIKTGIFGFSKLDNATPKNIVGFSSLEHKIYGTTLNLDGFERSKRIMPNSKQSDNDKKIAMISMCNNLTVITEDNDFYKSLKREHTKIFHLNEYIEYLKNK